RSDQNQAAVYRRLRRGVVPERQTDTQEEYERGHQADRARLAENHRPERVRGRLGSFRRQEGDLIEGISLVQRTGVLTAQVTAEPANPASQRELVAGDGQRARVERHSWMNIGDDLRPGVVREDLARVIE